MKKKSAWEWALEKRYRCGICGCKFNFEHLREKHLYKEHPEVFFRKPMKGY